MSPRHGQLRRGFSLVEAIIVVLVLAISIPPTVVWLGDAGARRADAVNAVRASTLSTAVMETILADASSTAPGLGFGAFANSAAYLDTPMTGLRARIASITGLFESMGFAYTVTFSALVDSAGVVNADPGLNLFRKVTVSVTYAAAGGTNPISISVEAFVTQL
ncbi:hypothetical protein PHYC_03519 [Phycisphaerales bacterium]|nr:hypothetical protein PHYC_03519 [Phycisphaerales bacterium]